MSAPDRPLTPVPAALSRPDRQGPRGSTIRRLLVCGLLSALLYAAMLAFVPRWWDGYSSAAQTVSELSAIGAPTRPLWVPLGILWTLLFAAFGFGVRAAAGTNRALRIAGAAIVAMGALGLYWPPMHLRGTAFTLTDALHIVWTAATGASMLVAMGFAAAALGRGFRVYGWTTMAILVGSVARTAVDAPRIAAGEPTPWVGLWERIGIAAFLVWTAALAVALLARRPAAIPAVGTIPAAAARANGWVAPGFERVRAEFERNFAERGEIGAAVAAYWRGEKVVDLWGGRRTPTGDAPWNVDTMVPVMSTTKGLAAMALAVANARGWLDYEAPVASYWPEFAQNGKARVTVRQLLGHEAGLVLLDERLSPEKLRDLDGVARILARQKPAWPPGTRHGYHTMTLGLYMQELIRRVDPAHRTLGRFFHDEIAVRLGLEFYIGLPRAIPDERLAKVRPLSPWRGLRALRYTPPATTLRMIAPGSLLRRSFAGLVADPNDRAYLEVEVPGGNGVGTARAIARAYSALAEGGAELGIAGPTMARLTAPPVVAGERDVVLGIPSRFLLGFARSGPADPNPRALGAPGAGGSFGFADPDQRLGYAYVMNRLDFYLMDDPREKALRDAVYDAIAHPAAATAA